MPTATAAKPEHLLKDLAKLWRDLGKEQKDGVLRACSLTFISIVDEAHDMMGLAETIASLIHDHPSRAIVIRTSSEEKDSMEARVLADCWMPFGKRQQICCERIEISSSLSRLASVTTVLRGITVPDLPVVLFCPNSSIAQSAEFDKLLPLADKLIVDSTRDRLPVLKHWNSYPKAGCLIADLAWGSITLWREAVARIYEIATNRESTLDLKEVRILYAGSDDPVPVYYLAGWFMHVLGAGVPIKIARGVGPDYASIARIDLFAPAFQATIELMDPSTIEIRIGGTIQTVVFPPQSNCDLLRKELSIVGPDRVFSDALGLSTLFFS